MTHWTKSNPLIVYPHHEKMLGCDEQDGDLKYSSKHGVWYVISPMLGYPYNTDIMSEQKKQELSRRQGVIVQHWLNLMRAYYEAGKK